MSVRRHRAVVAISAALALLVACSSGGSKGGAAATPPIPIRWIAAGDSYSSGEGGPGSQGKCGLSEQAMAPRARALVTGKVDIGAFTHVACTGAVIDDVLAQILAGSATSPQAPFNLVTMTIGGNDVGFAKVLSDCVGADDFLKGKQRGCDLTEDQLLARVDSLPVRLVTLYKVVLEQLAPRSALVIVGYPNIYSDPKGWNTDTCFGVSKSDATVLRHVASALDARIAGAVKEVGGRYVSVIDMFEGHELCGPEERWINGFSLGITNGTFRPSSSFHPTSAGQQAEGEELAKELLTLYGFG